MMGWGESKKYVFFFLRFIFGCTGVCCHAKGLSSCERAGATLVVFHQLLIWWLVSLRKAEDLGAQVSVVVAHGPLECTLSSCGAGLSCPPACGIPPEQGSNPCPLHGQADS